MEIRVQVCGVGEGMGGIRHKLWKENMSRGGYGVFS